MGACDISCTCTVGVREPDGVTQATFALPALWSCCSVSFGVADTVITGRGKPGEATRSLWPTTPAKKPTTTRAPMLIAGRKTNVSRRTVHHATGEKTARQPG